MRVKVSALALLTAALPALVFAYAGFGGGKGLFRVQNAVVEDEAGLTLSMQTVNRLQTYAFPDAPEEPKGNLSDFIGALSVAPVATKYVGVELFGSYDGILMTRMPPLSTESVPGGGRFQAGRRSAAAGGKLSIPVLPVFKPGFSARYTFLEPDATWPDSTALPVAADAKLEWRGLATFQFQDLSPSAPNLMVNYGKIGSASMYGVGLEWAARSIALYVEAVSYQPAGSSGPLDRDSGRIMLTPGVVLGSPTGVALTAGYTFGTGKDAVSELVVGLCAAAPFARRSRSTGSVTGTVTDSRSGAPVEASLRFPDKPRLRQLRSDSITGVFKMTKIPAGAVTVEVSAPGYNTQTVPIAVKPNEFSQYEFKLRPTVAYGTIAGVVTDFSTGRPLQATIEFPGKELRPVVSDSAGVFRVDSVETGIYTVTAAFDKYLKGTLTVTVEDGKSTAASFALTPAISIVTMAGKVTDKKTGDPLAADLTCSGTNLPAVKTDPATGIFRVDLPVGVYIVAVEAAGYIKQSAPVALEKDRPIIRDFELVKEGMAITLRGIYFNTAKATIKPESRPALEDAAKILKDNPTIKVEIQGHTDSQGSDEYNLTLSDKRAWAVVNYLIQNFGIEADRLVAKGYGEAKPVADNEKEEGRALNRRVEFVILGQR
jgi:outer membrane protein OmpA-like peptidoglycan-associated protein